MIKKMNVNSKGKPLPYALRARIMKQLHQEVPISQIARNLLVSRSTVYRMQEAASKQQNNVPKPLPMGGYRHSKVNRDQIIQIAHLALENPKADGAEIQQMAVDEGIVHPDVSLSTIYRVLKKTGIQHGRLQWYDPKVHADPLIALERRCFRYYQQTDPAFEVDRLLWMDQSNVRLWEQETMGWKVKGSKHTGRIPRPKGRSPYMSLWVTVGCPDLVHYEIFRPEREYDRLAPTFEASELKNPGRGVDVGYNRRQIQQDLLKPELQSILQEHGVKLTNDNDGTSLSKMQMIEMVLHLKTKGLLGLNRAGRKDVGGSRRPVIGTASDVLKYFQDGLVPYLEEHLSKREMKQRSLVLDNASIHGAPKVRSANALSWVHEKAVNDWNLRGLILTPPRDPKFMVVELVFAWIKRYLRHWAPSDGYTEEELVEAIHKVFRLLNQKIEGAQERDEPTILENWAHKCGYVNKVDPSLKQRGRKHRLCTIKPRSDDSVRPVKPTCQTLETNLPRRARLYCADDNGTVMKKAVKGKWVRQRNVNVNVDGNAIDPNLKDIYAGNLVERKQHTVEPSAADLKKHRWAGYGPSKPSGPNMRVLRPEMTSVAEIGGDTYEIEDIVDERVRDDTIEYLVSWKGYKRRTWINANELVAGKDQLERRWKAKKKRKEKVNKHTSPVLRYVPERVLDEKVVKKRGRRQRWFLIKWKGYPANEATWEPERNIIRGKKQMLKEYRDNKA